MDIDAASSLQIHVCMRTIWPMGPRPPADKSMETVSMPMSQEWQNKLMIDSQRRTYTTTTKRQERQSAYLYVFAATCLGSMQSALGIPSRLLVCLGCLKAFNVMYHIRWSFRIKVLLLKCLLSAAFEPYSVFVISLSLYFLLPSLTWLLNDVRGVTGATRSNCLLRLDCLAERLHVVGTCWKAEDSRHSAFNYELER